jgi:hypothetical protein
MTRCCAKAGCTDSALATLSVFGLIGTTLHFMDDVEPVCLGFDQEGIATTEPLAAPGVATLRSLRTAVARFAESAASSARIGRICSAKAVASAAPSCSTGRCGRRASCLEV